MVQNIDIFGIAVIVIFVLLLYIWAVWPTSRTDVMTILTPEKPARADEIEDDVHLADIRTPVAAPDWPKT